MSIVTSPEAVAYFRSPPVIDGPTTEPHININADNYLMLCNGNYLGMANNPDVLTVVKQAIDKYGLTASGSRWVCGTQTPHVELEKTIASHQGDEDAVLFFLVTLASQGSIAAIMRPPVALLEFASKMGIVEADRTEIYIDEHSHPSLFQAVALAKPNVTHSYRHNDMAFLERLLVRSDRKPANRTRRMIVTDGVNSAFGDLAPLGDIVEIAERFGALVCVDDAHGIGIFGPSGRGLWEHFGVESRVDLKIGSLAKAYAGGLGAFVSGGKFLADYLRPTAGHYIFGGSIPPALAAGISYIINTTNRETWRRERLLSNANYLRSQLNGLGFDTFGSQSQIVPILIGDEDKALKIYTDLLEHRIMVGCFRYPAVEQAKARIRLNPTALHELAHLDEFLEVFAESARSVGLP